MSAAGLAPVVGPVGPTAFAVLTWGSILLVAAAFGYVVQTLLTEGRSG